MKSIHQKLDRIYESWLASIERRNKPSKQEWMLPPPNGGEVKFCPCCHAEWLDGQGDCPVCNFNPYELKGE